MPNKEVTVCLTSTGRWDLLRRTIESFLLYNTYHIHKFIINDDSGEPIPADLLKDFPFIIWLVPNATRNQIASLDLLWSMVTTPYAFFAEDDWEFSKGGFIESSMEILEANPYILQVWLQQPEPKNQHPIQWNPKYGTFKSGPDLWAAFRFNPSLKRKADYDLIAPLSKHTTWNPIKPWKSEAAISKVYNSMGFKVAILPERYITHIGENAHVGP